MTPRVRKLALTAHVIASVGWLGAVAAFLALAFAGLSSDDPDAVRAAYVAMNLTAWSIIVPLAFASVLTGLIQSLGTHWGLVRHYWVLVKFVLTVAATVVLLLQLDGIDAMRAAAETTTLGPEEHGAERLSLMLHGAGGVLVLFTTTMLAVYKPRGVTGLGRRTPARDARG